MPDAMRAVVIAEYGGSLQATRRPVPWPGPGEVLVRVRASGLCSTDLHLLSGRQPLGELPRIVGHELAGDVVELGAGVTGWRAGDRVTAAIDVTCGRCRHCLAGDTQLCRNMKRIGFERDGGHADYVAVPAANLVALDDAHFVRGGGDPAGRGRLHVPQPDPQGRRRHRAAGTDPGRRWTRHPRRADRALRGRGGHGDQPAGAAARARRALRRRRGQPGAGVARGGGGPVHRRRRRRRGRRQRGQPRQRAGGIEAAATGREVPGRRLPRRDVRGSFDPAVQDRARDHRLPRQHAAGPDRRRPAGTGRES